MQQEQLLTIWDNAKEGTLNFECDDSTSEYIKTLLLQHCDDVGVIFKEDKLYENMQVQQYLQFFASSCKHPSLFHHAVEVMQLQDVLHKKIKKLTFSQKRRISFAREVIVDRTCLFIQEPLLNLDDRSFPIIMSWMEDAVKLHKKIMTTSVSFKHLCMLPGERYYMTKKELVHLDNIQEEDLDKEVDFEKISARLDDKILLFNPREIDYIESMNGKSFLNVRNDSFACSLTMDELEQKLRKFGFYRSHRSYLVNMQKVKAVVRWTRNAYSLQLEGNDDIKIPLSKGRVDDMKDMYHF